jgi:type II secretory pathway pseudopilin PulG
LNKFVKRSLKSFTLVEILIALAIIMLLTAISTPTILAYVNRAKAARAYMEMNYIKTSLQTFYNDWGEYPNTIAELRGGLDGSVNLTGETTTTGIEGPIDYLSKEPPVDLFYKLVTAGETKTYRYAINANKDDFVLWSYGPNKAGLTAPITFLAGVATGATVKDIDDILVRP